MRNNSKYLLATINFRCFVFLTLWIGVIMPMASAQTSIWTNDSNDNQWSNPANWSTQPNQSSEVTFNLTGDVLLSSPQSVQSLRIFGDADHNFINSSNGQIDIESGEDSVIWGAASLSGLTVQMGPGDTGASFQIKGSLSILEGSHWTNESQVQIGNQNDLGLVVVDGKESRFIANSGLIVGGLFPGDGGLLLFDGAIASVFGFASIGIGSAVGIHGGEFFFDRLRLSDAPRIVGSFGSIHGDIVDQTSSEDFDLSTISDFFDDDLDWTWGILVNQNQTVGATVVNTGFRNTEEGVVQIPATPPLHFRGYIANFGTITQEENGTLQTDVLFTNESTGNVYLQGEVIAPHGVLNDGHMEFNGANTNIYGRFDNLDEGTLRVGAGNQVSFYEEFVNNGPALTIAAGGRSVFLGPVSGNGDFQGDGLLIFANQVAPGEELATIAIQPNTIFGDGSTLNIDIGGPTDAEFDRLVFDNDVDLNGPIVIDLVNFYQLQSESFQIVGASEIRLGASFSIMPPMGYNVSHSIIDENGKEWLQVVLTVIPEVTVAPESLQITQGQLAFGTEADLADSDNVDLSIRRSPQSVQGLVQFIVTSTSPSMSHDQFRLRVESSVFARTDVELKIEAFNVANHQYEVLAIETATRFLDRTFERILPEDPEEYLDPNGEITARITFESLVPRQRFTANVDQVVWIIEE